MHADFPTELNYIRCLQVSIFVPYTMAHRNLKTLVLNTTESNLSPQHVSTTQKYAGKTSGVSFEREANTYLILAYLMLTDCIFFNHCIIFFNHCSTIIFQVFLVLTIILNLTLTLKAYQSSCFRREALHDKLQKVKRQLSRGLINTEDEARLPLAKTETTCPIGLYSTSPEIMNRSISPWRLR